ncbi:hypothetical protein CLOSTMETH_00615 [[Clostridium] methylpentosum DSM 5476]|uniref:Uncharacterized protein n=1 Tax=[Clostridium] methylpentosum DSM 5476 TaxID=537013 RepID=C0E9W4_9FIRM|nr:hypothetical protein CLOSTMETH_00615 [[Clostridium] methylpentosum DSM 5476]
MLSRKIKKVEALMIPRLKNRFQLVIYAVQTDGTVCTVFFHRSS